MSQVRSKPSKLTNCIVQLVVVALMLGCFSGCALLLNQVLGTQEPDYSPIQLQTDVNQPVTIPDGYTLVEASAYGRTSGYVTLYCQKNDTNRIFICSNGVVGREIVIPEGFTLVAAYSYGVVGAYEVFYCRENETGLVYICSR